MTTRRSRLLVAVITAAVLAPGALVAYAMPTTGTKAADGIPGLPGLVGQKEYDLNSLPGDPARGLEIFRSFCSGCHDFKAAGIQGGNKPGSDLDARKPTFTQIVRLIVQGGGGGLPSKLLLRQLNFQQIYDVAAFVALYADKPGPVPGASRKMPVPVELSAPLRPVGDVVAAGRFRATLSGRALRWRLFVGGQGAGPETVARIQFTRPGKRVAPVVLNCSPCATRGNGFIVITKAQAQAMRTRGPVVVVNAQGTSLRGAVKKLA